MELAWKLNRNNTSWGPRQRRALARGDIGKAGNYPYQLYVYFWCCFSVELVIFIHRSSRSFVRMSLVELFSMAMIHLPVLWDLPEGGFRVSDD